MGKVVVLGDIGGQIQVFEKTLEILGVDSQYRLPEGTSLVQVGDIVRNLPKGNELFSRKCLELADRLIDANEGHYIQLFGNHEFAHINQARYPYHWRLDPQETEIINHWWETRKAQLAATLKTQNRGTLISHAGLTREYWSQQLGSPRYALDAMSVINGYIGKHVRLWSRPGYLVSGYCNHSADILWAGASVELLPHWVRLGKDSPIPFEQIHGHSTTVKWSEGSIWDKTPEDIRPHINYDVDTRLSHVRVGSLADGSPAHFYSVDWVLGNSPVTELYGLRVWEDAEVRADVPAFSDGTW